MRFILLCCFLSYCQNLEIKNGNWYDGDKFQNSTLYIVNGKFSDASPSTVDQVINLNNKYIIPPFGEAHTHNLAIDFGVEHMISKYINEGTIYISIGSN